MPAEPAEPETVELMRWRCRVCTRCKIAVSGTWRGRCPYGGPYDGYVTDGGEERKRAVLPLPLVGKPTIS